MCVEIIKPEFYLLEGAFMCFDHMIFDQCEHMIRQSDASCFLNLFSQPGFTSRPFWFQVALAYHKNHDSTAGVLVCRKIDEY